jgi:hypothetical protein
MVTKTASESSPNESELVVDFIDESHVLAPGEDLTFGRAGDIVIDENRYLHRILGRFHHANGLWWLSNVGSAIPLTVSDTSSPSFAKLAPGATMPLSFDAANVSFEAGGASYELAIEQLTDPVDVAEAHGDVWADSDDSEVTRTASSLPLSDEQRLLLVALAEPQLRDPSREIDLPTNRQLASSLRWTITKFNRKLDGLCRKYAAAGVSGLHGSTGALARDRRARLVEHTLHAGIISTDDLHLLEAARSA